MAEYEKDEGSWGSDKKPVFDIKRINYERWFRHMKLYLLSKSVWWTVGERSTIKATATPDSEASSSNGGLATSRHAPVVPPVGRSYDEDNAKAMLAMMRSISEDDQQLVEDAESAKEIWLALKAKYEERLMAHARQHLKNYVNFEIQDGQLIDDAWSHLQTIGRRITAIVPDLATLNKPQHRIHVLLGALPPQYTALVDTIDGQPHLSPDQILARLHEKEMTLGKQGSTDTAMVAHSYDRSKKAVTCFLCDGPHGIQLCPHYEIARKAVAAAKNYETARQQVAAEKDASTKFSKVTSAQTADMLGLLRRIEKLEHAKDGIAAACIHLDHKVDCKGCMAARNGDEHAAFAYGVESDSEGD